jgi:hypothetical protein
MIMIIVPLQEHLYSYITIIAIMEAYHIILYHVIIMSFPKFAT